MGIRGTHMGLEGFGGDLCLCLGFGSEPRAILLPSPPGWGLHALQAPRARAGARTQFGTFIWRGDSCPSHCSQQGEDVFRQVLIAFLLRLFQALSGNESTDALAHPSLCPPAARGGNGCSGVKSV